MNWKLFALLAPIGPILGTLTVMGVIPRGADRFIWAVITLGTAWLAATREPKRALAHGAAVGFWNGATSTAIQAVFRDTLLANNPWMREHFASRPNPVDLAYHLFLLIPFIGVAAGGLTGLLAMLLARFRSPETPDNGDADQTAP